ncbi:MAG: hypothetical protein CEE43_00910 [Promethearchaeota archaeon Loki_b32]|nr:MAG: hypothetical protein CEE43_00910 [Candidatus Lokiarchaeota archaeon Loki_b32]
MDLFEWVKDIEKVYEDLIGNAKKLNLNEIEEYRKEQNEKFEDFIIKINVLVNTAIGNITVESDIKTNTFEKKLDKAIQNIETEFKKNLENLQKLIIEEVGLDF